MRGAEARCADLIYPRLPSLVEEIAEAYDVVVLDSPPFLRFSESLAIAHSSGVAVAIARAGITDPREFQSMLNYLERLKVPIGAVVLTDVG